MNQLSTQRVPNHSVTLSPEMLLQELHKRQQRLDKMQQDLASLEQQQKKSASAVYRQCQQMQTSTLERQIHAQHRQIGNLRARYRISQIQQQIQQKPLMPFHQFLNRSPDAESCLSQWPIQAQVLKESSEQILDLYHKFPVIPGEDPAPTLKSLQVLLDQWEKRQHNLRVMIRQFQHALRDMTPHEGFPQAEIQHWQRWWQPLEKMLLQSIKLLESHQLVEAQETSAAHSEKSSTSDSPEDKLAPDFPAQSVSFENTPRYNRFGVELTPEDDVDYDSHLALAFEVLQELEEEGFDDSEVVMEMVDYLLLAIDKDPTRYEGFYLMGYLFSHLGQFQDAMYYLELARKLTDNPKVFLLMRAVWDARQNLR